MCGIWSQACWCNTPEFIFCQLPRCAVLFSFADGGVIFWALCRMQVLVDFFGDEGGGGYL